MLKISPLDETEGFSGIGRGCPKAGVESLSQKDLKIVWMCHLGTWLSGCLGCAAGMVGLHDLRGLFQP